MDENSKRLNLRFPQRMLDRFGRHSEGRSLQMTVVALMDQMLNDIEKGERTWNDGLSSRYTTNSKR